MVLYCAPFVYICVCECVSHRNSLERFHNYVNDQLRDGQNRLDMYTVERHAFAAAATAIVVVVALICLRVNCKCFLFRVLFSVVLFSLSLIPDIFTYA